MLIDKLKLKGFRNISEMELSPCPTVNIIYGANAQGKTNLIEAMWLFTGAKSFRGSKEKEFVMLPENVRGLNMHDELLVPTAQCYIDIEFFGEGREQTARLEYLPKKSIYLNEIPLPSSAKLAGKLYCVVFSPNHLSLIQDGPEERRSFIDTAICQLKPKYIRVLTDYKRVLLQRNQLLKDSAYSAYLLDTLDVWDNHFIRLTTTIIKTRHSYIEKLKQSAEKIYRGISNGTEEFSLEYVCKACENIGELSDDEIMKKVTQSVKESRGEDLRTGTSNCGANRDDINIYINGLNIRQFGSQGQQRSAVLALKLSECGIIEDITEQRPVVLLDDVMSELDNSRRDYLLNHLKNRQIFITCCDKDYFKTLREGKSFRISEGTLQHIESFGM